MKGPIGTNRISQEFGGAKDRGVKKNKAVAGSRNISGKFYNNFESGLLEDAMNPAGTVNRGKLSPQRVKACLMKSRIL